MGNVVSLRQREPLVWTCECGCLTHYAYDSGVLECAACGNYACSEHGNWLRDLPDAPDEAPEIGDDTFSRTDIDLGNADLALRRTLKAATVADASVAIVVLRDGDIKMWVGDGVNRADLEANIAHMIAGADVAGKFKSKEPI